MQIVKQILYIEIMSFSFSSLFLTLFLRIFL